MQTIFALGFSLSIIFCVSLSGFLIVGVNGIDLQKAKEGLACYEPNTVFVNPFFALSADKWYYNAMSQLDLFAFSLDISGKAAKDLSLHQVYNESCITMFPHFFTLKFSAEAFPSRQRRDYWVRPLLDWNFGSSVKFAGTGDDKLPGTVYITLTDNKSFLFVTSCLEEYQEMTWAVATPIKEPLSPETLKLVHEHAASLGFKKEFFTQINYEQCTDNLNKAKSEL